MVKDTVVPALIGLVPLPAELDVDQSDGEAAPLPRPVREVVQEHDETLGPEQYRLRVRNGRAVVASSSERGAGHAATSLERIAELCGGVPDLSIADGPALEHRGIIEGFYGEPWSDEERIATFRLARRLKLNSYVYAPKDDPFHRVRWRDPYPDADLARIARLAEAAASEGIEFVFALHPAGSMRFSSDEEHVQLAAKAQQLIAAGIRRFALLFDDVPPEPVHPEDAERFGDGGAGLGAAHADAATRFARETLAPAGIPAPLVVPTDYAGTQQSEYRRAFAAGLPGDVLVWWTGRDIVVGEITRDDIDAAGDVFGDRVALWDNFPVNDFDRGRAFLGPLLGRTRDLTGSALRGAWTNPMVECAAGWFGIAAFADWAWNPAAYDPQRAAQAALALVAGEHADALAPLVRALSSWPPSAPSDPELAALVDGALAGEDAAALRDRLMSLSQLRRAAADADAEPARTLRPWLTAAADAGRAGLAALDVHENRPGASADAAREALEAATAHEKKVAADVIPGFVRAVLAR